MVLIQFSLSASASASPLSFREIRNLVLCLTEVPAAHEIIGIHHQVSQATGLYNAEIHMRPGSCHRGIFMENGSGGILQDLKIFGGHTGAVLGNQQFTVQDLHFEGCSVGIDHIWSWGWVFQNIRIVRCNTGILLRAKGSMDTGEERKRQAASACTLLDWSVRDAHTAVLIEGTHTSVSVMMYVSLPHPPFFFWVAKEKLTSVFPPFFC